MIDKEKLKDLYDKKGSVKEVAKVLGVPYTKANYYINKYNLNSKKHNFPYDRAELMKLHEEHGSITKVASFLSRPYATVRHWYNSFDIIVNKSGMTIYQELRVTPMSNTQKSVLIGSMLGDGGIWRAPHSKNARLYVCHCHKQLSYLKWVHDLLQPFSRPIVQTEKAGEKIIGDNIVNGSDFYRFYTIAHPDITDVYRRYYNNNYKTVTKQVIDELDLLGMAIWFGDDGSVCRNNKKELMSASISTNSFSYKEQLILVEALRRFFKGTIRIKKQCGFYKGTERQDFTLQLSNKKHINDFIDMIKLVLPESIHYKLS